MQLTFGILLGCQSVIIAQSQQEVFCQADITWASHCYLDIAVAAKADQDWDRFLESGLSNEAFKQQSKLLNQETKSLMESIIEQANDGTLEFYETEALKHKKHYQSLDLTGMPPDDAAWGDSGEPYAAAEFELLRIYCWIVYDKAKAEFRILPKAAAPIRTGYDGDGGAAFYTILGWLPIQAGSLSDSPWSKRFYCDVGLGRMDPFKKVMETWTLFEQLLEVAAADTKNTFNSPKDLLGTLPFEAEKRKTAFLQSSYFYNHDTDSEEQLWEPIEGNKFVGVNFALDLTWNSDSQQLMLQQKAFSPICEGVMEDEWTESLRTYVFSKPVK